jgi:heme-degrading monooxygenase HmoA
MFVRITRTESTPEKLAENIANYQQRLMPEARKLAGFAGAILLADRSTGAGASVTFWENEEAMRASEQAAETLRTQATQTTGARVREVDRFELVVQEQNAPPQANTFVRTNDLRGTPDKLGDVIRFAREAIPVVKQRPGFKALVVGVNRQSGRSFVTSVWASAVDRDASEAGVREMRRELGQKAGADEVQVELFEVVFAEVSQAVATTNQ